MIIWLLGIGSDLSDSEGELTPSSGGQQSELTGGTTPLPASRPQSSLAQVRHHMFYSISHTIQISKSTKIVFIKYCGFFFRQMWFSAGGDRWQSDATKKIIDTEGNAAKAHYICWLVQSLENISKHSTTQYLMVSLLVNLLLDN